MSESGPTAAAPASNKLDPESFELRGSPARVTRFRRGLIIMIAGAGSAAIMGIGWLALKPGSLGLPLQAGERVAISSKTSADTLANAPESYGDVPKLGPPLPGDLGRPILARQRQLGLEDGDAGRHFEPGIETERQRAEAEKRSVRSSAILMKLEGRGLAQPIQLPSSQPPAMASEAQALEPDPGGQRHKLAFLAHRSGEETVNPDRVTQAPSPHLLFAGSVIAASLITGINSDLPGLVTAQVTENIFDSATGQTLLIPQGARLVGTYDSQVAFGQKRALVAWQRIIFPDGSSIGLDNAPASDPSGYAGLADRVDRHGLEIVKGVALSTLLGVGTEIGFDEETDVIGAMREAAQESMARAGSEMVTRSLDIQPTIRVRPGWPLRIVVRKDLVLRPWRG